MGLETHRRQNYRAIRVKTNGSSAFAPRAEAANWPKSFRQRDQITLEPRGLFREFVVKINLVQVCAHAQQHPPRSYRREVTFFKSVMRVQQILDAICFR